MDPRTWRWWTGLRTVSVANLALWCTTAAWVPLTLPQTRWQLGLAGVYTLVCGFRSFFPRVDLERTVLIDHPLSNIVLGRSAATIAEMAFTLQIALWFGDLGAQAGQVWVPTLAWSWVPLIAVAQTTCWLGVLTRNDLWHGAEESLWGVFMAGIVGAAVFVFPATRGLDAGALTVAALGALAGAFVMLALDVPMYIRRHRVAMEQGARFLGVRQGFLDAWRERRPTDAWDVWRHEVHWMTPYFSVCVWASIAMVWLSTPR